MTKSVIRKPDGYRLTVSVHHGCEGDVGATCAVLIDIVNNNLLGAENLREFSTLFILEHVPKLGRQLAAQLIGGNYTIYVEAPPDITDSDCWPRWVRTYEDIEHLFTELGRRAREALLYPLALWALPKDHERHHLRTVSAFSSVARDHALFREALASGVMRLSLQSSSFTLTVNCSRREEAEQLVRNSIVNVGMLVDWED